MLHMLHEEDGLFYRRVAKMALPILAQGLLTYLVGFVDNIMVGQLGTEAMSGVAIANQLHFVYATCLLGIVAGGSVFGAQFYGNKDLDGFRESFRFRFLACLVLSALAFFLLWVLGERFLSLFLFTRGDAADAGRTLRYGKQYLTVLLMGMVPYALTQVYAGAMKEMGETLVPMIAGIMAIVSNTVLNYLLIFGNLGFPGLGVKGAAIATVLSRVIELAIILFAVYRPESNFQGLHHAFGKGRSKTAYSRRIFVKGLPLMVNEFFWSIGTVIVLQCYSFRGIQAVAGLNIATSMYNIFTVVYQSVGGTVAIMMGQLIGAGKMQEARETNRKLFSVAVRLSVICGILLFAAAPFIPQLYVTTPAVKDLAARLMQILALCLPISCFTHVAFFTIRAGGKTVVTFLYDSLNLWVINIPLAFCLTRYTDLPMVTVYFLCQMAETVKLIVGYILVKKGVWLNNIVQEK